jgi:hypothetical protein
VKKLPSKLTSCAPRASSSGLRGRIPEAKVGQRKSLPISRLRAPAWNRIAVAPEARTPAKVPYVSTRSAIWNVSRTPSVVRLEHIPDMATSAADVPRSAPAASGKAKLSECPCILARQCDKRVIGSSPKTTSIPAENGQRLTGTVWALRRSLALNNYRYPGRCFVLARFALVALACSAGTRRPSRSRPLSPRCRSGRWACGPSKEAAREPAIPVSFTAEAWIRLTAGEKSHRKANSTYWEYPTPGA